MNKVNIVGRLTTDIELRRTNDGKPYVLYTLAVNGYNKDDTKFVPCMTWNAPAEYLATYASKGTWIGVNGQLNPHKMGEDYKMNVNAVQVEIYSNRENTSQGTTTEQNYQQQPNHQEEVFQSVNTTNDNLVDINIDEIEF